MKTMNEKIHDELTAHTIYTLRYIRSLQSRYSKVMVSYNDKLRNLLSSHLSKLKTKNLKTKQWDTFLSKLKRMRTAMFKEISSEMTPEVNDFRKEELWYLLGLFGEVSPIMHKWKEPKLNTNSQEVILGETYSQRFNTMLSSDIQRINMKTRRMYANGYSINQIIRAIVGVSALGYAGSAVGQSLTYLRTNIQSILSAISEGVLHGFNKANSDVISYEVFVAVLDSRTTIICADADGNFYRIDAGLFPPLHENCRSRRYPLIAGSAFVEGRWFYMKDGDGYVRKYFDSESERKSWIAKYIGGAPADYTYEEFLRRQSLSFQEDVLGKTKAQLFRNGKLKLGNFLDSTGRELTLPELRAKYSKAFARVS